MIKLMQERLPFSIVSNSLRPPTLLLRKIIFTSAMVSVSKKRNGKELNPVLYEFYRKKCLSKPKKVALGAVMHKLVAIIFAVLRDRKPFELRKPEEHAKRLVAKNLAS